MEVTEVPFCDVCRQSVYSQSFKKHMYTKKHQLAADRWFQSVACLFERQCDTLEKSPFKYFCSFCHIHLHTPVEFLEHFQCERHRTQMHSFCMRNRCDSLRLYRQKLTLSAARARHLSIALKTTTSEKQAHSEAIPSVQIESKPSRKCVPIVTHERINGSQRVTESANGNGMVKISRSAWNSSIGNVFTSVTPPWMGTEQMENSNSSEKKIREKRKGAQLWSRPERNDIFAHLAEEKYTPDWLPNFGGVWQSGPRSQTKQNFIQKMKAECMRADKMEVKPSHIPAIEQATKPIPTKKQLLDQEKERLLLQKERLLAKLTKRQK
uniref:Uncharacterized protein AlNc14C30G2823 n=1 Tax=Albugo laibachii Nc14 TaxID=890382 RepID=F0W7L7_9STRA|nr:conserved hypothetical protein [Albugo laibachii Nc14]|eukprot:CCA17118.1 conserved hypothetical protein [Albugo laibachii Nc14]